MSDILKGKNYDRPEGFTTRKSDHVYDHGDLIPMENYVSFVLPYNREEETPEPNTRMFAVSDARLIFPGDKILVDLWNGKSSLRVVARKFGRVLWLKDALPCSPKISGEVYKILGFKSTQIDTRFDLETGKGMDKWLAFEKKTEEAKEALGKELLKEYKYPLRRKPGAW